MLLRTRISLMNRPAPPIAGCEWHPAHETLLKIGPICGRVSTSLKFGLTVRESLQVRGTIHHARQRRSKARKTNRLGRLTATLKAIGWAGIGTGGR